MFKKIRKYIELGLILVGILSTGGIIGGAVAIKAETGLKVLDVVLEKLEPTPTPEAFK